MPTPAMESAWDRLRTAAAKLVEAADQLDDAGGLHRLAAPWTKAEKTKARSALIEAMQAIKGQLALLNAKPAEVGPRPGTDRRSPD